MDNDAVDEVPRGAYRLTSRNNADIPDACYSGAAKKLTYISWK